MNSAKPRHAGTKNIRFRVGYANRLFLLTVIIVGFTEIECSAAGADRPNILWITCEDMDPNLGCYGDTYAVTPTLDKLARCSIRYNRAFATAPCCSPARSCLITGVWPNAMGTPHLRNSTTRIPAAIHPYPKYLREAGYYCTNNSKEDYNFAKPQNIWNESSNKAHWRNRPRADQPFFAVFNLMITHQGQLRQVTQTKLTKRALDTLPPAMRHDPAGAPVPPYYPDTPVVRRDIATHYDCISAMDCQVGRLLDQLEEDGLTNETIIFFYSDHGRGMPRHKRWLNDSGLRVPLLVHFPEKYRHLAPAPAGTESSRLVSFIDFPVTLLSILDLPIPNHMQGVPFAGPKESQPRRFVYASRDRVDEVIEVSRCVRDERYHYIRHYMPHRPMMQFSTFSEMTPTRGEIRRMAAAGKVSGPTSILTMPHKPIEELYDTQNDPWQLNNLTERPEYSEELRRMRSELRRFLIKAPDACLLPEAMMHARAARYGVTVYEMAHDRSLYPIERIVETAELVGRGKEHLPKLVQLLEDADPGIRYWATVGLRALGNQARQAEQPLLARLQDDAPDVRIAAADALCQIGESESALTTLTEALTHNDQWARLHAAAVLHELGERAQPALPVMKRVIAGDSKPIFLRWSLERTIKRLESPE
ncbi:MAG: sulfatase-like hydrolase/transferase [Pirellulales bacterium]|nr:sulfatase-like hydrolase/transferase [Pirellulales bacterium]